MTLLATHCKAACPSAVDPEDKAMARRIICLFLALLLLAGLAGCGAAPGKASFDREAAYGGSQPPAEAVATSGDAEMEEMYAPAEPAPDGADFRSESRVAQAQAPARAPMAPGAAAGAPPPAPPPPAIDKKPSDTATDAAGTSTSKGIGSQPNVVASPMLIYTADVHMAVFETTKAMDAVEKLARDMGGYLVRRADREIQIRVPAGKFDGSLDEILKLGDVQHKNVSVQDVTEEFVDLTLRIRNLEVVRARLEELLKKADKVPDAIAVERELERVTSQLERMKGRLKLIGELVRFSTITVHFAPRPVDHVDSKVRLPFPWLDSLGLGSLLSL